MRHVGNELKTIRTTFRDSIIQLVNYDLSNEDIEENQGAPPGKVFTTGETQQGRNRDFDGGTWAETVLRSGKVVREQD